jgi:hypothetical protein
MNKYLLLIILNVPFIVYGLIKATIYYKEGVYSVLQLVTRVTFWILALVGVLFTQQLYNFLIGHDLTNSSPLSIADVLLATFSFLSLTMIIRLYARMEKAEKKVADLNEELALRYAED